MVQVPAGRCLAEGCTSETPELGLHVRAVEQSHASLLKKIVHRASVLSYPMSCAVAEKQNQSWRGHLEIENLYILTRMGPQGKARQVQSEANFGKQQPQQHAKH